jgi:hypothetical protein
MRKLSLANAKSGEGRDQEMQSLFACALAHAVQLKGWSPVECLGLEYSDEFLSLSSPRSDCPAPSLSPRVGLPPNFFFNPIPALHLAGCVCVCGLLIDGTRAPACRLAALRCGASRQPATSRKLDVQESACTMHSMATPD